MLKVTPFGAVRSILGGIMVGLIAMTSAPFLPAQLSHPSGRPAVRLPAEAAGALGEAHDRKVDSDLRIALVRHPDFATKVRSVVVECASTTEQPTLDRYMNGDSVPRKELQRVWKATSEGTNGFCDSPLYSDFLVAVREVNARLPADRRIRVLGGDPGPGDNRSREVAAVSLIRQRVLTTHGGVLVVYGAAHFYRTMDDAYWSTMGEDRALKARTRPVLVSLQRVPFRDFTAEEFLGRSLTSCRGSAGCRSVFKGSALRLGQMGDAAIYVGPTGDAGAYGNQ